MTSPHSPDSIPAENLSSAPMDAAAWSGSTLNNLAKAGEDGISMVNFIETRQVKIGFRKQKSTGAMWFLDGNIYLNANTYSLATAPTDAFMLSLVAHEALHLKQGIFTALSVYGELESWQLGFRVYQNLGGAINSSALDELMKLPFGYDREMLNKARSLMQEYAGKGYRIDLLPRYPFPEEVAYFFTHKVPA
jgi:hypothetical protein